jgi:hypothetical protein
LRAVAGRDPFYAPNKAPSIGHAAPPAEARTLPDLRDLLRDLPAITKEEIQAFLEDRAHDYVCPFCHSEKLGASDEMPYSRAPINGPGDQRNRSDRFIPLIWLVCQNCGYVAYFLASIFLQWRENRA